MPTAVVSITLDSNLNLATSGPSTDKMVALTCKYNHALSKSRTSLLNLDQRIAMGDYAYIVDGMQTSLSK